MLQQCNQQKYHIVHLTSDFNSCVSVLNGDHSENGFLNNSPQQNIVDPIQFHACLRIKVYTNIGEVEKYYFENSQTLRDPYGILLFLYSVIATRVRAFKLLYWQNCFFKIFFSYLQGLEQVRSESDTSDPLIDETYGYGSQSLINLMITGRAVTYVWDNVQDVGGLSKIPQKKNKQ